jgi:hypothetical protein
LKDAPRSNRTALPEKIALLEADRREQNFTPGGAEDCRFWRLSQEKQ